MQRLNTGHGRPKSASYARKLAIAGAGAAARVPLLRVPLRAAYERYFNRLEGSSIRLFSGVYPDFAAALRTIPSGRPVGYDNPGSARRNADELFRVFPLDYPVLFWLQRLLPETGLLFDWGGNIGVSYYSFRKHLSYPENLSWLVCDVPAVVKEGFLTLAQYPAPGLSFTTSLERMPEAEILLAAGSLHFIDAPFDRLRAQTRLPNHILLNKVPVYPLESAVTLQNMGTALLPNHLFNESDFLHFFVSMGFTLKDHWETELGCHIPFHPEHSIRAYKGFYFAR
jgi:putative methyltransferase (TIGR04325 family)